MSNLTRLSVNLTERSSKCLDLAADITKDTKTDTVNHALQAYAWLMHHIDLKDDIMVRDHVTGETQVVAFLGMP